MTVLADQAGTFIGNALSSCEPADREAFAKELLTHAAAGLVRELGHVEGAHAVYALADVIATTGEPLRFAWEPHARPGEL